MAAKVKMFKLLQEIRGFAEIARRRPTPRLPGLVLMQMRSYLIPASLPKRKLSVQMHVNDHLDIPHPVKINHVRQAAAPGATSPSP
jgi:hypothetical protein